MTDHHAAAINALVYGHNTITEAVSDKDATMGDLAYAYQNASILGGQEALVHSALHLGKQMAALAEQQRLANVIAAYDSGVLDGVLDYSAAEHIRARIGDIVNPAQPQGDAA